MQKFHQSGQSQQFGQQQLFVDLEGTGQGVRGLQLLLSGPDAACGGGLLRHSEEIAALVPLDVGENVLGRRQGREMCPCAVQPQGSKAGGGLCGGEGGILPQHRLPQPGQQALGGPLLEQHPALVQHQRHRGLKAEGHTIIVAEHRLYYLTDLADRFLYMENGSIKEEWTAGELRSIPEEKRRAIGIRAADLHHIEVDISPVKEKDMTMEVKDLAFSYRKHPVFHDVSFQAYAGDLIAIVGHNGIGKTTLSNILCGMQKEKEGQVIYNGTKVSKGKRKNFAYFVMQNTDCQLFGDSVEEELLLNGKGSTQEQRDDLLKLYGLFEWKERHPATLSGGQKQRLTLAVSDWIDTPVLILDEPTSGLDFKNMMRISEHLKALAQKGKTILIITHDYEFAAMTCNRVLHFVDEGHVETFPLQENLSRLYSCLMCQ